MAIQFVGGGTVAFLGSTGIDNGIALDALTGGLSSAPSSGDLVIAVYATGSTADRSIGPVAAAFTEVAELYSNGSGGDTNLSVAWAWYQDIGDDTVYFGPTGNAQDAGAAAISVWRHVDPATPLDVTSTTATGTGTARPDGPSITPITSGSVVIVCGGGGSDLSAASYTQSGSELSNFITISSTDTKLAMVGVGAKAWTSGAFNPVAWTGGANNAGDSWAAVSLALRANSNLYPDPDLLLVADAGEYGYSNGYPYFGPIGGTGPGLQSTDPPYFEDNMLQLLNGTVEAALIAGIPSGTNCHVVLHTTGTIADCQVGVILLNSGPPTFLASNDVDAFAGDILAGESGPGEGNSFNISFPLDGEQGDGNYTFNIVGVIITEVEGAAASIGSASATGTATAVGKSNAAGTGSAACTGAATGVGRSIAASPGSASGTGTATATGLSTASSPGSAAASGSGAAVGASIAVAVGSASASGSASGAGLATAVASGAASGSGSATATGAATSVGAGSAAGLGSATAAGNAVANAAGSASGLGTASAIGSAATLGVGSAAGVGSATATGAATATAAGAASGVSVAAAVGKSDALSSGAAAGAGSAAATGQALGIGAGQAGGAGAASAIGSAMAAGTGAAQGSGTATADGVAASIAAGSASAAGHAAAIGQAVFIGVGLASGFGVAVGVGVSIFEAVGNASALGAAAANGNAIAIAIGEASASGDASAVGIAYIADYRTQPGRVTSAPDRQRVTIAEPRNRLIEAGGPRRVTKA